MDEPAKSNQKSTRVSPRDDPQRGNQQPAGSKEQQNKNAIGSESSSNCPGGDEQRKASGWSKEKEESKSSDHALSSETAQGKEARMKLEAKFRREVMEERRAQRRLDAEEERRIQERLRREREEEEDRRRQQMQSKKWRGHRPYSDPLHPKYPAPIDSHIGLPSSVWLS